MPPVAAAAASSGAAKADDGMGDERSRSRGADRDRDDGSMSPKSTRLVRAMQGSMRTVVQPIEASVNVLAGKMQEVQTSISSLSTTVTVVQAGLVQVQKDQKDQGDRIQALERARNSPSSAGSVAGSEMSTRFANPQSGTSAAEAEKRARKVIVIGGLDPQGTAEQNLRSASDAVVAVYKEKADKKGEPNPGLTMTDLYRDVVEEVFFKGKGTQVASVEFKTPAMMWGFVRFLGNKKLTGNSGEELWTSVDKPLEERIRNKALNVILAGARDKEAARIGGGATRDTAIVKKTIQPNWDRGFIFYHPDSSVVFRKVATRDQHENWHVDAAAVQALNLDYLELPALVLAANEIS